MDLWIVRHGEPIYGPDTLTDLGRRQAQALADRFAVHGLHRVYSSPQGRALETAEPTAQRLGLPVTVLPWVREVWPEMTLPQPDGSRRFVMDMPGTLYRSDEAIGLGEKWYAMDCLAGSQARETFAYVAEESDRFLAELGYRREGGVYRVTAPNEERIAVFCHAGLTLSCWLPHLMAIPPHLFWAAFDLTHSGVTLLHWENSPSGYTAPKCLLLSDMSHIYKADLPFLYNGKLPM